MLCHLSRNRYSKHCLPRHGCVLKISQRWNLGYRWMYTSTLKHIIAEIYLVCCRIDVVTTWLPCFLVATSVTKSAPSVLETRGLMLETCATRREATSLLWKQRKNSTSSVHTCKMKVKYFFLSIKFWDPSWSCLVCNDLFFSRWQSLRPHFSYQLSI